MARLLLQDGTAFEGESFGAPIDADGEVVFTTGMVGYPESLTDPSYHGQILVFTYPLIGNYGVPSEELNKDGFSKNFESEHIHVRGVVVAQASEYFSHHAAVSSFPEWLKKHGIPGITGIDTRALTKKLREHGVMLGRIAQDGTCHGERSRTMARGDTPIEDPNLHNLVAEVSCKEVMTYEPMGSPSPQPSPAGRGRMTTILAYDCGMKRNILRNFLNRGVRVIRVPWDFDLDSCNEKFDGVFISNGPGDPKKCEATIRQIQKAMERNIPMFGICLGTQLMALAIGGDTYKMKYGHRGANQPCLETPTPHPLPAGRQAPLVRGRGESPFSPEGGKGLGEGGSRCIITSQNHGYAIDEKSLPADWRVWFRNANDGTVEGIRHTSGKFFAVQFHPESSPGPEDANDLFDEFLQMLKYTPPRANLPAELPTALGSTV
ncbi:glutamine-hydrolyzing carbamoyl-phosphate synthase small subunit [Candidatus Peregrinibacteria bacterium]|nr:glutamine-hydrolyzing carbamoyl-phosphate synthase small subunit [Candidatus Peregrinibacteria bacterium]